MRETAMERKVAFLDLRVTDEGERTALLQAVEKVLRHGRLVLGPEVEAFEQRVATYCGRKYAVGVNSGTDALYFGLRSLGIGPGDEVITTALSWVATANAIALTGATAVFADIRDDLNIDPESVRRLLSPKTRALLPVHYTGRLCDMKALSEIAEKHKLLMIEDAAQAFGAHRDGRRAGAFGVVGCFSMNPMKVPGACGEAGVVVTDREDLRDRLISLRYNGTINRETCVDVSVNGRLDTIQAAILLERLDRFDRVQVKRREIAARYRERLGDVVRTPQEPTGEGHAYYTFTILADRRDELRAHLERCQVETKIQHPILMADQPAYRDKSRADCPNARKLIQRIVCIPANEKLAMEDVDYVARCIRDFYGRRS
jgi:dTDP-4-amino-4,6-dideoxygalactose transaminase